MYKCLKTYLSLTAIAMTALPGFTAYAAQISTAHTIYCHVKKVIVGGNDSIATFGVVALKFQGDRVEWFNARTGKPFSFQYRGKTRKLERVIRFDFSDGGDQYEFVDLLSVSLSELLKNATKVIAKYENGYDYINGYSVSKRLTLECGLSTIQRY